MHKVEKRFILLQKERAITGLDTEHAAVVTDLKRDGRTDVGEVGYRDASNLNKHIYCCHVRAFVGYFVGRLVSLSVIIH